MGLEISFTKSGGVEGERYTSESRRGCHLEPNDPYLTVACTVVPFLKETKKVKVFCISLCLQDLTVMSTRESR